VGPGGWFLRTGRPARPLKGEVPRVAVLLLLAVPALGNDLVRQLDAPEAKDRAWACWRAGEQHVGSAVPALRRRIGDENALVRRLALDALIRIGAEVPWQELQPVWDSERACALVLLARDPDPELLLELLDLGTGVEERTAICNVLAGLRAPGFAAWLLAQVKVSLDIRVVEPSTLGLGGGCGGAMFGGRGGRRVHVAPGWPPSVHYELVDGEAAGAVVFAPGPYPVAYLRHVVENRGSIAIRRTRGTFDGRPPVYLAAMLQIDELPLSTRYASSIAWRGADPFLQELADVRKRVRDDFGRLVAQLREQGLLTQDEANRLEPAIDERITDLRADRTVPLPEPAAS